MASPPAELDTRQIDNITSTPPRPYIEIPDHLTRRALMTKQKEDGIFLHKLWNERGQHIEQKVKSILEGEAIVQRVTLNKNSTPLSDLTVELIPGNFIHKVQVEVKSSSDEIRRYKQKIRDTLPEGQRNMDGVKRWMTENGIILINGGEKDLKEKTPEEILSDSFYPQLERILTMASIGRRNESSGQMILFPETDQIQIWPGVPEAEFTQLFP